MLNGDFMKTLKLLSLLLVVPLLSGCSSATMPVYEDADKYVVGNKTYEESITSLDIDWISGSLALKEDTSITGAILTENSENLLDPAKVHSYYNNGDLKIKFFKSGYSSRIDFNDKQLILTYNPTYLKNIKIDLTSGKLTASNLSSLETINIQFTSGSSSIGKISTLNASVSFTSGGFDCDEIDAKTMNVKMTSGNFFADKISANIDLNATSGTVVTQFGYTEQSKFNLTSGDLRIKIPEAGGSLKIEKTSGYVNIGPKYVISDDRYLIGDGVAKIDVKITSGSVRVN